MKRSAYWLLIAVLLIVPALTMKWVNSRPEPISCAVVKDALRRFSTSDRYETVVTQPGGQTKTLRVDRDIYISEGSTWQRITETAWQVNPNRFGPVLPVPIDGAEDCLSYGTAEHGGRPVTIVAYRGAPRLKFLPAVNTRLPVGSGTQQSAAPVAPGYRLTGPVEWQEIWIDGADQRPRLLKTSSGGFETVFRYEELVRPEERPGNISCEVVVRAIRDLMMAERYALSMVQGSIVAEEIVIGTHLYQKMDGRWRRNDAALQQSRRMLSALSMHGSTATCEKTDTKTADGRTLTAIAFPNPENVLWIDLTDGRLYGLSSPKRLMNAEYRYQNIVPPSL